MDGGVRCRVALGAFFSVCVVARSEHTLSSDLEVRDTCHARLPPGGVQGRRACAHTPSQAAPPVRRHQLHPQGCSTYLRHADVQGLLSSGNLADVEFTILPDKGDGADDAGAVAPLVPAAACTFLAHRAVLVARSPFWATQFSTGMQGSSTPVGPTAAQQAVDGTATSSVAHKLTISDCPSHVFKAVLLWIYTDRLDLDGMPPNDVVQMLCFADMVLLENLRDKCSLWLQDQLTVDNVAVLWERASHANARGLEAARESFMVCASLSLPSESEFCFA